MKRLLAVVTSILLLISLSSCIYRPEEKFQDNWHGTLKTHGTSGDGDFLFEVDDEFYYITSDYELKESSIYNWGYESGGKSSVKMNILYPDTDGFIARKVYYHDDGREYKFLKVNANGDVVSEYTALNEHLVTIAEGISDDLANYIIPSYYIGKPIVLNVREDGDVLVRVNYDWYYQIDTDDGMKTQSSEARYYYILYNQLNDQIVWSTNYLISEEIASSSVRVDEKYIYEDDTFAYIHQYSLSNSSYVYGGARDIGLYETYKVNKSSGEVTKGDDLDLEGKFFRSFGSNEHVYTKKYFSRTEVRSYSNDFSSFTEMIFEKDSEGIALDFVNFGDNNLLIESFAGSTNLSSYDNEYNVTSTSSIDITCNYYSVIGDDKLLCIDIYNPQDTRNVFGNVYVYDYNNAQLNFVSDELYLGSLRESCFFCWSWPT